MKYSVLIFLLFISATTLFAQNRLLIFKNVEKPKKSVQVKPGAKLLIQYKGYLGQPEMRTSYVYAIGDSSLVLTNDKRLRRLNETYEVNYSDIIGFRKLSISGEFVKKGISAIAFIGTSVIAGENSDLTEVEKVLFSLGVGLAVDFILHKCFPDDKVKHYLIEGWIIEIR